MERAWIKTKKIVGDEGLLVLKRTLNESVEDNSRNISARRNDVGLSAAVFNRKTGEELCW